MHFAKRIVSCYVCGLNDKYTLRWMLNCLIMVVNCMGTWKLMFKSWFVLWAVEKNCFPWNWSFSDLLASSFWALVDLMFHKPTYFPLWEMAIYVMWQHFWCPNVAAQIIYFDHVSKSKVKGSFDAWCISVSFSTSPPRLRLPLTSLSLFHYNFFMLLIGYIVAHLKQLATSSVVCDEEGGGHVFVKYPCWVVCFVSGLWSRRGKESLCFCIVVFLQP